MKALVRGRVSIFGAAWLAVAALLPLAATSCSSAETETEETSDDELTSSRVDRWSLPPAVSAAGAKLRLRYENAPAWEGGRRCTGSLREGAQDLGHQLIRRYDAIASIGGYACRQNTADATRTSVHGIGRALDIMVPTVGGRPNGGRPDIAAGDPIANWLVVNAASIGVQMIIWNGSVWRANGTNIDKYTGPNPHIDHVHVELTERAASRGTPFFLQGAARELSDGGISGVDPYAPTAKVDAGGYSEQADGGDVDDPNAVLDAGPEPYPYHPYSETPGPDNEPPGPDDDYDPYGVKTPPVPPNAPPVEPSPASPTPSSPATPDAGAVSGAPTPYPNLTRTDNTVGAPDSLGTGTRPTPRSAAQTAPKIETCALAGVGVGITHSGREVPGWMGAMAWLAAITVWRRARRALDAKLLDA